MTARVPGDDVLLELGRLTWAAITVDDLMTSVCGFIEPSNPREDRRPVGRRITAALRVIESWPASEVFAATATWLREAQVALEERNALLHAVPLVESPVRQTTTPEAVRWHLGVMPRGARPYREHPLEVASLQRSTAMLDGVGDGWMDKRTALFVERRRLVPDWPRLPSPGRQSNLSVD